MLPLWRHSVSFWGAKAGASGEGKYGKGTPAVRSGRLNERVFRAPCLDTARSPESSLVGSLQGAVHDEQGQAVMVKGLCCLIFWQQAFPSFPGVIPYYQHVCFMMA